MLCKMNDIDDEHEQFQVFEQWRVLMMDSMSLSFLSMVEEVLLVMNDDQE